MLGQFFSVPWNFEIFRDILGMKNDTTTLTLLGILAMGLKFGPMMHITMKHIVIENGHAGPIFACSVELWNF